MRSLLRLILAAALGLATALLVACGGGGGAGLIPSGNAGPLKDDFDSVASAVNSGDCGGTRAALERARTDLHALPPSVDPRLRKRLGEGLSNLAHNALLDCAKNQTQPTTSTATTPTTPPTETTTQPPTTSTPTETTPPPPRTTPTVPAPPPAPPGNGGGVPAPGGGNGGDGGGGGGD